MKILTLIILISLFSCSVTYETRTKIDVKKNKQKIDSIQLQKNNIKYPSRWKRP